MGWVIQDLSPAAMRNVVIALTSHFMRFSQVKTLLSRVVDTSSHLVFIVDDYNITCRLLLLLLLITIMTCWLILY